MPDSEVLEPVVETRALPGALRVREAVRGDAAAVRAVLEEHWLDTCRRHPSGNGRVRISDVRGAFGGSEAEKWLDHWFSTGASSLVQRVAERAGEIVGFLGVSRQLGADELSLACELPDGRGRGAACAMFRDVSVNFLDRSRPLVADFPAYDAQAQAALARLGFDPATLSQAPGFHRLFPSAKVLSLRMTWDPELSKRHG